MSGVYVGSFKACHLINSGPNSIIILLIREKPRFETLITCAELFGFTVFYQLEVTGPLFSMGGDYSKTSKITKKKTISRFLPHSYLSARVVVLTLCYCDEILEINNLKQENVFRLTVLEVLAHDLSADCLFKVCGKAEAPSGSASGPVLL